eukprot:TRINITY_DN2510_c0_g1_i12.p1 TRINITY_DN2510_c0_g1~~TRINITY_DN2510_c0_g1_i12.p1  ORF type:complete len:797 (+),score=114.81 TRINITY_DN2510_c0_g1_i12:128-2518(+)
MSDSVKIQEESNDSSRLLERSVSHSNDEIYFCLQNLERLEINIAFSNEEEFTRDIVRVNEILCDLIKANKNKESQKILEKIEKILELAASRGKNIDRNLIIVILFNIAANFQAMWQLEKCGVYIEAAIFNIISGVKEDEDTFKSLLNVTPKSATETRELNDDLANFQGRLLKKYSFIIKSLLQYCAILSQLSQHEVALKNAYKALEYLKRHFILLQEICNEQRSVTPSIPTSSTQKLSSPQRTSKGSNIPLIREEIHFSRLIIEYSSPILDELVEHTVDFDPLEHLDIFIETKKCFYNWKNNPENNEKHVRKEFKASKSNWIQENRNLIGVAHEKDWISTLNIGTIMHMMPMSYYDLVNPEEHIYFLSKDQIMEKLLYQSICFFTISTEMRFIDQTLSKQTVKNPLASNGGQLTLQDENRSERHRISEIYHLKSIEIVCKYIPSPCPYINHLISSYQKHYNQNLETIPEESISIASSKPLSPRDPLDFIDTTRKVETARNFQSHRIEEHFKKIPAKQEILKQTEASSLGDDRVLTKNHSAVALTDRCIIPEVTPSQKTPGTLKNVTNSNHVLKTKPHLRGKPPTPGGSKQKGKADRPANEEHKDTPKMNKEESKRPATARNNYDEWLEIIDIMNQREKRKRSAERGKTTSMTKASNASNHHTISKTPIGTAKTQGKSQKKDSIDPQELEQKLSIFGFQALQKIDLSALKATPREKDNSKRIQTPNNRNYIKKKSSTPIQRGNGMKNHFLHSMTTNRIENIDETMPKMVKSSSNQAIPSLNLQKIAKLSDPFHRSNC